MATQNCTTLKLIYWDEYQLVWQLKTEQLPHRPMYQKVSKSIGKYRKMFRKVVIKATTFMTTKGVVKLSTNHYQAIVLESKHKFLNSFKKKQEFTSMCFLCLIIKGSHTDSVNILVKGQLQPKPMYWNEQKLLC